MATSSPPPDFHSIALAAYVEVARATGDWPDSNEVKRLAYHWYEEALRESQLTLALPAETGYS